MKNIFTTKKNKTFVSVIAGIALAGLLSLGSSYIASAQGVTQALPLQAVEFIGSGSGNLASRIGSLTVGSATSASWINSIPGCATSNSPSYTRTCLGVQDTSSEGAWGTFSKLWVNGQGLFMDGVVVSTATQVTGGGAIGWLQKAIAFAAAQPEPAFLIHDIEGTTQDSMLISGLGRYSGTTFAPQNLTTQRQVCAAPSGALTIC